jgi:acyl carrier protein
MELREQIYRKLVERAAPIFGMKPEDMKENLRFEEDLHVKSVQISQITTYLEDAFDVEVPFMTFRRKATIGEAADYVLELCS